MRKQRVHALLMGGQACVFYGAAEFSRDTDFALLANSANLARLRKALDELQADPIAVPRSRSNTSDAATPFISVANIPTPCTCAWILCPECVGWIPSPDCGDVGPHFS